MNTEIGRDPSCSRNIVLNDLQMPQSTRKLSSLVVECVPSDMNLQDQDCFIGIGVASQGRPIDVVALLLAAAQMRSLTVVLVDEFAKLNGLAHEQIELNVAAQQRLINAINETYQLDVMTLRCGAIMATQRYAHELEQIRNECLKAEYRELLIETVPPSRRHQDSDFSYTVNEIALTRVMATGLGYTSKFGPLREKSYDQLMQAIGVPINFCYAVDALPVGVMNPKSVVHYVSTNVGNRGAERILLESDLATISRQLETASPRAAAYLLEVATQAAELLGFEAPQLSDTSPDIVSLTRMAVLEYIVKPLQGKI